MNELLKRSITGILYVFLLLTAIMLSNAEAFGFLFLVFGLICLYEIQEVGTLSSSAVYLAFSVLVVVLQLSDPNGGFQ